MATTETTVADDLRSLIVKAQECFTSASASDGWEGHKLLTEAIAMIDASGWPMTENSDASA